MLTPENYSIICAIFPRLLGVIYFCALFPFLFQIRGLIGKKGITPVGNFLSFFRRRMGGYRPYYTIPTIFWINCSDAMLMGTVFVGVVCSLLLAFGFLPWFFLLVLIVIHLSIVTVGQEFLSFGWEMFFLEISYHAFLLSLTASPNLLVWISVNVLIFRFHLQAGASKLQTHDPNWRNLTALCYHYETQPIPNPLAWYFHKLPKRFHQFSTGYMFFAELIVPFGVFGNEEVRLVTFVLLFLLQLFIAVSGNYSYLNYLTMVLITLLISDRYLGGAQEGVQAPFGVMQGVVSVAALGLITLQLMHLWNHFFPKKTIRKVLNAIYPYHFANRYGIFAVMTTTRYEVVVKGSDDQEEWKEYGFYFKPSSVKKRPGIISPFQPRLDWQVWFLPFSRFEEERWFENFLMRLLEGEPQVLQLLEINPFTETPPKYIKSDLYVYQFSPWSTKKKQGDWWVRSYLGSYSPVLSLDTE